MATSPRTAGNSKFQCNLVVAGHGLLLFSCCQDLMQTNCRNFSRPHIVNLWNWEGNKYKVNRADLFHCVKVCLWPVLHSLTVPGLERLNGWTPMISTLSIPLPSSRSGIRMWYIGFCWRYTNLYSPTIADTINGRRLWAHFSSVSGLNLSGRGLHVYLLRRHVQTQHPGGFQEKQPA